MVALALGVAAPALAADLAMPAPEDVMYNWSGFYVGGNAGVGSSHSCWTNIFLGGLFTFDEGCHNATGGLAGAQIGYRWQSGALVLGLEAQGDWASLEGSNESTSVPAFTNRSHINALGLFTVQAGYAVDNALLYLKGGAAVTNNHFDVLSTPSTAVAGDAADQARWGTTLGVGVEYGFTQNWSLGIEYNHLFMPDQQSTFATVPASPFPFGTDNITQGVDLVTARLNYRF
jgi:outer membrane immunogenic protein